MAQELLQYISRLIDKTEWPSVPFVNAKSQHIYETGVDILNLYRGNPRILVEALGVFYQTESQPYSYAGIAAVLMWAAYSHGDEYDGNGIAAAQRWLDRAQNIIGDRIEINVLQAQLYINGKQLPEARQILDSFQQAHYEHFLICLTELQYWSRAQDVQQAYQWYRKAAEMGISQTRKICILNALAACYLANKCWTHAIDAYQRLAPLDPNDPWLWHNMSIAHFNLRKYRDAQKCNKKALALMDFEAARHMQRLIQKRKPAGWFW